MNSANAIERVFSCELEPPESAPMSTRDPTDAESEERKRALAMRRQRRCRARDRNNLFVAHVEFPREAAEALLEAGYLSEELDADKLDKLVLGRAINASWCDMWRCGALKRRSKVSADPT